MAAMYEAPQGDEQKEAAVAAVAAAAAPSFDDRRAQFEASGKKRVTLKANSTSSVFAQSSLTDPDVDELILRCSRG